MFQSFARPGEQPAPSNPYAGVYPQLPGLSNSAPPPSSLAPYNPYAAPSPAAQQQLQQQGAAAPGQLQPYQPWAGQQVQPYGQQPQAGGGQVQPHQPLAPPAAAGPAGGHAPGSQLQQQPPQPANSYYNHFYRPYFAGPTTSLQPQPLETVAADEDPVYGPLGRARAKIERALVGDNEISPDLADTLGAGRRPLVAQDEPLNLPANEPPYVPPPTPTFRPVKIVKSTPLPDALHQELNYKHLTAKMGLFEEIGRAWFTVDNKLFLWDYQDGRDFSRYDEQPETIQAVGLVRARKDVFVDDISHVLVICTAARVSLLGLSLSGTEISLYATNLSAAAPLAMVDVRGTHAGRMFALGADKDLYEIEYSTGGGWLSGGSKMSITNRSSGYLSTWVPSVFSSGKEGVESFVVEPAQGRLFALHTRGEVEYIDVSSNKFDTRAKYGGLRNDFIRAGFGGQAPGYAGAKVVSIAAIGAHESKKAWLVAVSASGARAYLGSSYASHMSSLALVGQRPPPPDVAQAGSQTFYSSGTFVAVSPDTSSSSAGGSKLTFVVPHCGRQSAMRENYENFSPASLQEWAVAESIPSQVWTVVEAAAGDPARAPPSLRRDDGIGLSALPRQAAAPARALVILSTSGVFFATQPRPVDALAADVAADKDAAIAAARATYGRVQLAAMGASLGALAASTETRHADASSAAAAVLFSSEPPSIRTGSSGGSGGSKTVVYSSRHDGLATAMARALRPVWHAKVTVAGVAGRQMLGVSEKVLLDVQGRLEALRRYVDEHPFPRHQADGDAQIAWDQEELSLHGLHALLKQAVEAISFVLLLSDYKLPDVIMKCDPNTQSTLASLTFQSLLTSTGGREVARRLVTALIEQQLGQELGIDTLSEILQQRCGSFCQPGDVVLYKAEESLRRAEGSRDPVDRAESLAESLRLFSRAASSAAPSVYSRLPDVSKRYRVLGDVRGAIELPLGVATQLDPHDRAVDYVRDGRHDGDPRKAFYEQREECYKLAVEALYSYDEALDEAVRAGKTDSAMRARDEAYALAIGSDDELFHFYLYDWHVARGRSDQLLEFDTPYIERYLRLTASDVPERRDLLWKYYARREEYMAAARALHELATRPGGGLAARERSYYLAQALTNAKSAAGLGADDVEFTTALQERVDVAQVQMEVARAVESHPEMEEADKRSVLHELNGDLLDLDQLYQRFARPLRLYDAILLILKTADTRVPDVVEAVWRQLLVPPAGIATPDAFLANVVVDLCRKYWGSEGAPADIVVPVVYEAALASPGGAEGWATRALIEGGVPLRELWDVVQQMYEDAQDRDFYAAEAAVVIEQWLHSRSGIPPAEFASAYLLRAGRDPKHMATRRKMEAAKAAAARF